jgi:hypothetical protein
MRSIAASEARNKLGQLLDLVPAGAGVHHHLPRQGSCTLGAPAACPQPGSPGPAVQRIRERAEECKLGRFDWSEWKSFRDEGRT